jgi:hypothetical protein
MRLKLKLNMIPILDPVSWCRITRWNRALDSGLVRLITVPLKTTTNASTKERLPLQRLVPRLL